MTEITSLDKYRKQINAPDVDQTYIDDDGVEWFKFGVEYLDQRDKTMTFHIWATSLQDAEDRLQLIKSNSTIYGKIISEVQ